MNHITRAASDLSTGGMILAVLTVLFMTFFVGNALWLLFRGSGSWSAVARLAVDDFDNEDASNQKSRS